MAENIITLFLITRFLKFSADFLTSSLNLSSLLAVLASVLTGLAVEAGLDSKSPIIYNDYHE